MHHLSGLIIYVNCVAYHAYSTFAFFSPIYKTKQKIPWIKHLTGAYVFLISFHSTDSKRVGSSRKNSLIKELAKGKKQGSEKIVKKSLACAFCFVDHSDSAPEEDSRKCNPLFYVFYFVKKFQMYELPKMNPKCFTRP